MLPELTHGYVENGGVRLHYVEAGAGPLVVLLHGFPEFWYGWRNQIPALAQAGYRVVAPDQRGYNLSDKPEAVDAYRIEHLSGDVACLIEALGEQKAVVVGHDWGAGVAWDFAMRYPDRLEKLVIMNVPHPGRLFEGLRTPRQLRKSWYMFFFQLPWLPEAAIRAGNWRALREVFRRDPARTGAFTEADIEQYVQAVSRPGAITAMINWYRAAFRVRPSRYQARLTPIQAPVMVIWGEKDRYLGAELAEPDQRLVPRLRMERFPGASHWVQHDEPERVNALLLDFLRDS